MVNIDNVMTAIGDLVDKAKDMEVEKIATVGLVTVAVIGTAVNAAFVPKPHGYGIESRNEKSPRTANSRAFP